MVGNVCVVTWYKISYCLASCKWILQTDGKLSYQITKSQKNVTIQTPRDPSSNRDCVKSDIQIGLVMRDLLEEIPVRKDKARSQRRLDDLSDHDRSWPPWREGGRMEGWIGSILDCSAILRKCSEVAGKSLRKVSHQRNPFSPRNGPVLVFLPLFNHRLETAHGKYGFHVNAVIYLEHSGWDHQLITPSATGAPRGSFSWLHRFQYLITFRIEHLIL